MSDPSPGGEALFDAAACALLLTATDGLILRMNGPACAWLGYDQDELVGKRRMQDLLPMGARLFYHTHCQPLLQAQGSVAELSAADRRKDEFLATLSHELRNPLAPMRSALDVFTLRFGKSTDGRLLDVFDRQLRHLTRLVDDLMEMSRITQGRMQLRRGPVELSALLRSAAQDMAGTMQAAGHTLRLFLADGPVLVDGDATRLAQVVVNLLTNAAKYTPEGGLIELHLDCAPGMAELRVRDSGIGIPAAALATVFDMFSQLEPALERSRGGLGIGLALVRGIVALHGGTIAAESPGPGLGSTFTVRLPLAADADCSAVPVPQAPAAAQARVVVVDDNQDAAVTLAMALEASGCEVAIAHSATEALELVAAARPWPCSISACPTSTATNWRGACASCRAGLA